MPVLNDADRIYNGANLAARVYAGPNQVWPRLPAAFDAPHWGTVIGEYDFTDLTKITHVAGKVTAVAPKSGTAGPITDGGNAAWRPTTGIRTNPKGANALDFGPAMGAVRLYQSPQIVAQPITVAMVALNDSPAVQGPQMFGDDPGIYTGQNAGQVTWTLYASSGAPTTVQTDNAWHVRVCVFNGAGSQLWHDGVLRATANPGGAQLTRLVVGNYGGGGYGFDGAIAHAVWWRGIVADIPGMSASLKAVHGTP